MNESRPHWKEVTGYEGLYEVSDQGAVRSLNYLRTGNRRELKPAKDKKGYQRVYLYRDGVGKNFSVHRIVWEAFNDQIPEGMEIDHINAIRDDNRLVNLRVVTHKENANNPITYDRNLEANKRKAQDPNWQDAHRKAMKRISQEPKWREAQREAGKQRSESMEWRESVRKARARAVVQLDKITGEILREWECIMDIEHELGISQPSVSKCCQGKLKSAGGFKWQYAGRPFS